MNGKHIGWSSEKLLWEALDNFGQGLSWKKILFAKNMSDLVPGNTQGVYLICATSPAKPTNQLSLYTVLYAGKVSSPHRSLRMRFIEHNKNPNSKLKKFMSCYYPNIHFWCAELDDTAQIDELESLLIQTFNPPCNSKAAPGTGVLLAHLGAAKPIGPITATQPQTT